MTAAVTSAAAAESGDLKPLFKKTFDVACTVDVEHTNDSLHAYVLLDDFEIGPGDEVIVRDPPMDVAFGGKVVRRCRATVIRAGLWGRIWTPISAYFELTGLYEVGFDERNAS